MKYYKIKHEQFRARRYYYMKCWGEVLQHSIHVNPKQSIEIEIAEDFSIAFNLRYYKETDDTYTVIEIDQDEFLAHYNETSEFIKSNI